MASQVKNVFDFPQQQPLQDSGLPPVDIDISGGDTSPVSFKDGVLKVERADGSVAIDLNPDRSAFGRKRDTGFDANLAHDMDDGDLAAIASELLEGIELDEDSRRDWLEIRSRGISLLGLKLEEPRGDTGTSSAPLEGMSTVRHPLLLEASVAFQAGARGELLPAKGPIKIRNDTPTGAPPGTLEGSSPSDELATALETYLNKYLITIAREYYPDTDKMLFSCAFGGDGFKKIYHCPLRRRPVSESVDAENLIVSNAATDLSNCGRVTHRLKMRKSVLRRMQLLGAYRDIHIQRPSSKPPDEVEQKKAEIGGYKPEPTRPEDKDFTIYEIYCELDLDEYAPKHLKGECLPLPYKVTIEPDSRQVLEVKRNWRKEDETCQARQVFVQFPFIRALGFYGLGFVHLLGNTTIALTAAWREMLDAGMFANFPGFVYAKQAGRQLTNQFRVPPGGGIPLDVPGTARIQDMLMPIPYKEVGPAFSAFIQHVEEAAKQLAMTANSNIGEGKQDAPVGTTLALIEQATKVIASAFKRLHAAQVEEFALIKDLFIEDPEALWRHNRKPLPQWQQQQFIQALNTYELTPVADPNNPTSLHRMAKGAVLKTLQASNPMIYDAVAVDKRIMAISDIDPEGLFKPPQPPGPDPVQMVMQMKQQQAQMQNDIKMKESQLKAAIAAMQQQGKAADRASKERIEAMKFQLAQQQDQSGAIDEQMKAMVEMATMKQKLGMEQQKHQMDMQHKQQEHGMDMQQRHDEFRHDAHLRQQELGMQQQEHMHQTQLQQQDHQMNMQHSQQQHELGMHQQKQQQELDKQAPKPQGGPNAGSNPTGNPQGSGGGGNPMANRPGKGQTTTKGSGTTRPPDGKSKRDS